MPVCGRLINSRVFTHGSFLYMAPFSENNQASGQKCILYKFFDLLLGIGIRNKSNKMCPGRQRIMIEDLWKY